MQESDYSRRGHYYMRSLVLCGFILLIIHLNRQGNLGEYVTLRMAFYVKLSAVGLSLAAVHQLYSTLQFTGGDNHDACDCGQDHSHSPHGSKLVYVLFLLPLVIGFLLPDGAAGR